MCEFCSGIKKIKRIGIPVYSVYSDDNVCDIMADGLCDHCKTGCDDKNYHFTLSIYSKNQIQLGFYREINNLIISPNSVLLKISYCPFCGEKLREENIEFSNCVINDELIEVGR